MTQLLYRQPCQSAITHDTLAGEWRRRLVARGTIAGPAAGGARGPRSRCGRTSAPARRPALRDQHLRQWPRRATCDQRCAASSPAAPATRSHSVLGDVRSAARSCRSGNRLGGGGGLRHGGGGSGGGGEPPCIGGWTGGSGPAAGGSTGGGGSTTRSGVVAPRPAAARPAAERHRTRSAAIVRRWSTGGGWSAAPALAAGGGGGARLRVPTLPILARHRAAPVAALPLRCAIGSSDRRRRFGQVVGGARQLAAARRQLDARAPRAARSSRPASRWSTGSHPDRLGALAVLAQVVDEDAAPRARRPSRSAASR